MMRNKIFTGLAALAIISFLFGCASKDKSTVKTTDGLEVEVINEADEIPVAVEVEPAPEEENEAPAKEGKKNYTGWVSTAIRPITNTVGNIKLNVRPKKGTFSIAVLSDNDKGIPVLSTANEYTTTSLYLKAGKKILKLCDDTNVVAAAKKTAKGVAIRYTIEKVALVQLDFECIASVEGQNEDTIKITASVKNLGKKKNDFSLKLLLDTVLGETDRHHFYTSDKNPVKSEVLYRTMKDEKWIVSKNAKATMQIILDGSDVTPVESVALANFTTLDTKKWEADMTNFRSFDTVLSYNNSAVGIYWPKSSLEPEEEAAQIFYISIASGENLPGGAAFVTGQSSENPADDNTSEVQSQEALKPAAEKPVESIQAVKEEAPVEEKKPEEVKTETKPVPAQEEPQSISSIKDDRLSLAYIQMLLDKIESLEEGDPNVNKDEINALNAELDEILAILNAR